jgi:drug/metabolite transporter (DMT)-like permease
MKIKDTAILFLLAAIWGSSFLFMRICSPVLGPFLTIELRSLVAGLALLVYAFITRHKIQVKNLWKKYLAVGILNGALPHVLFATASLTLDSSFTSILNSTTPLFAVIAGVIWLNEKMTLKKLAAVFLGIIGVTVLIGWNHASLSFNFVISAFLCIIATMSYAVVGVFIKKAFKDVSVLSMSIGQQLSAALILMPFALTQLPSGHIPRNVIFSIAGLALMCTAIASMLLFYLISSAGPTKTQTATFLVPIFGMIWGAIFLKEKITVSMIVGLFIILLSVFMILDIKIRQKESCIK